MDKIFTRLENELGQGKVKKDVILASYSTLRIGGPAQYFYEANTKEDLIKAIRVSYILSIPVFILGGGTNLLISDSGFKGLVIKNKTNSLKIIGYKGNMRAQSSHINEVFIEVDSGVGINRLVRFTLDEGLSGLENFLGQPGSVGGALYINAHNMNMNDFFGDHIYQCVLLSRSAEQKVVDASYFHFGYDQSKIQKTKEIVISLVIKLVKSDKSKLWEKGRLAVEYRKMSQPQGVSTSGCTFRNIDKSDAIRLATPAFTTSSGYLMDKVGLKGKRIGDVQFSPQHSNFLINLGRGRASDVVKLINLAKERVKEEFGVNLTEEVVLVGF